MIIDFRPLSLISAIEKSNINSVIDAGNAGYPLAMLPGETEILNIMFNSRLGDEYSFRILKHKYYEIVVCSDHTREYFGYKSRYDEVPTQGELYDIFIKMTPKIGINYWEEIFDTSEFQAEDQLLSFISIHSDFYPNISEMITSFLLKKDYH